MRKYDLDLQTLLSLLRDARQTGILSTELPLGFLKRKVRCWGKIKLVEGEVASCYIEDEKGGMQFAGNSDKKILNALYELGALSWQLDAAPSEAGSSGVNDTIKLSNTSSFGNNPTQTSHIPHLDQNTFSFLSRIRPTDSSYTTNSPSAQRHSGPLPPLQPDTRSSTKSAARRAFSDVPRLIANTDPRILYNLSRRHRRILALVDGTRSAERIGSLLFSTPRDAWIVLVLLQELESMGIITWENR